AALGRPRTRGALIVLGALLAILSLPASVALPWWAPAPLALLVAVIGVGVGLAGRTIRATAGAGVCAAVLAAFAILTSLIRPELTAAVLAGVIVAGVVAGAVAARRPHGGTDRLTLGGLCLALALAAIPPAIGSALYAAGASTWWAARGSVIGL